MLNFIKGAYRPFEATSMRMLTFAAMLLTTSLGAQESEKIHDVGKDGLKLEGRIDAKDPKAKVVLDDGKTRQLPAKIYAVKLQGGKSYRLIMSSKELDSFLIVRDDMGKQVDHDDDSAGDLDSALTLDVTRDGTYTVAAAALEKSGRYALIIRELSADDPPSLGVKGRAELARATQLNSTAGAFFARGQFNKAIAPANEALAIRKKFLGEQHLATAVSLTNVGNLHEALGDSAKAQTCHQQALAIYKTTLGEQHLHTAVSLSKLGALLRTQGDFAAARPYLEQALAIRKKVLGEQHPETATSLNNFGALLHSQDDFATARPYLEQALAIRMKVLGRQHSDTADSLFNLGALLHSQGDFAAALTHYQQALAIRKKVLGEQHRDTATSLNNLGLLLQSQGDSAAARPYYEQLLAIRKKTLGDQHPDTARSLDDLGVLLFSQRDFAAARPYLEQALAIRKKVLGEQHPDTATSLNNLGHLLDSQGDSAAARPYYQQALTIRKKVLGEQHPDTAASLHDMGFLLQSLGDSAAARPYYEQALTIRKKIRGEQHPDTVASLSGLGTLLHSQGDFAAARPYLAQSLAINKKIRGEQHPDTATSLNNLGLLLQSQGDFAEAQPYFEQALTICKKVLGNQHPDTAGSLNSLGLLLQSKGDSLAARPYLEQALAINKKVLGEQHPATATSLGNLGFLLQAQGDNAAARPFLEQALAIRQKVLGDLHPDTANSLNSLGGLIQSQGDYAAARPYFEQALAINKKVFGEQHPVTATAILNLGGLFHLQGDSAAARRSYEQALAIRRRSLDLAATALSERQQLASTDVVRGYLDSLLAVPTVPGALGTTDYDAVLGWKGTVSLRQRQLRLVRNEPGLATAAADLLAATVQLANLSNAIPDPKKADEHRALLVKLTLERENIEVALARDSEPFRAAQDQARLTGAELAQALPLQTAVVDFLEYWHHRPDPNRKGIRLYERRLTAFVVRRDAEIARIELGPVEPIAKAVEAWREAVVRREVPGDGVDDPGPTLRRLLWTPLEKHLAGAKTILLSPDGAIASLPFAALPGREPGTYLIEDVNLSVVPLPKTLPALLAAAPNAAAETLLLVGDVDYGADTGKSAEATAVAPRFGKREMQFDRLDNTRGEILALRDTFERRFRAGKVTVLREDEATEVSLRKGAPEHRWLHIATHGFFAPPEVKSAAAPVERKNGPDLFGKGNVVGFHPGLLSGIALTGANRVPQPGSDDGILTATEVAELDLRKTELVVLSACETGLGKVAGGEGILGLQRAFQVAGAGTTVASLWKVDDAVTRQLMEKFYDNLWKAKMPKAEALRQAQLFVLREGPTRGFVQLGNAQKLPDQTQVRRSPPHYWAAWVLSGDWR